MLSTGSDSLRNVTLNEIEPNYALERTFAARKSLNAALGDMEMFVQMDDLILLIRKVFASVSPDPSQTLHMAELTDQAIGREISQREWKDARGKDQEQHWYDVPRESLLECESAIFHLEPDGWRFYLPAYLTLSLRMIDSGKFDCWVVWTILFVLTLDNPVTDEYKRRRYDSLALEQKLAVQKFLQYVCLCNDQSSVKDAVE